VQKLSIGKTLAFHSYKGGTGKTTLVTNLAASYALTGMRVALLDFDLYAPSLTTYFQKTPELYLNDLLAGDAEISDILVDVSAELGLKGKLFIGFSSARKEDIHEIEIHHDMKWQFAALRRFLAAKKELFSEYKLDYIILDTSPGIRYWAINAIAAANLLFLMMKASEMDITGTKKMITEIYDSLIKFGSKYFIILNKIPGASPLQKFQVNVNEQMMLEIEENIGPKVIGAIPCFCDIQFNRHEFLYAIKQPKHQFSKSVLDIANKIKGIDQES
jgi:MinD-like ATPase involved in chromosome partitioning or flagellar assembly